MYNYRVNPQDMKLLFQIRLFLDFFLPLFRENKKIEFSMFPFKRFISRRFSTDFAILHFMIIVKCIHSDACFGHEESNVRRTYPFFFDSLIFPFWDFWKKLENLEFGVWNLEKESE